MDYYYYPVVKKNTLITLWNASTTTYLLCTAYSYIALPYSQIVFVYDPWDVWRDKLKIEREVGGNESIYINSSLPCEITATEAPKVT